MDHIMVQIQTLQLRLLYYGLSLSWPMPLCHQLKLLAVAENTIILKEQFSEKLPIAYVSVGKIKPTRKEIEFLVLGSSLL